MPLCHWPCSCYPNHALGQIGDWMAEIYFEPYATSHESLDADAALQEEVRNVARAVVEAVSRLREGHLSQPDSTLHRPRPK